MAKYQTLQEPVAIIDVDIKTSQYGGEIYEIKMVGIKTQTKYYTYADPKNNNWGKWEQIVDVAQRKGVVVSGCKLKDPDKGLINADSSVTPEYIVTKEELADTLEEFWASQSHFNRLFGE